MGLCPFARPWNILTRRGSLLTHVLVKRSFTLSGHRTSVALEPEFWAALDAMAKREHQPVSALVAQLDAARHPADPLASRLRVQILTDALTFRKGEHGNLPGG